MTVAVVTAAALAVYAAFLMRRVRIEKGWVGVSTTRLWFLRGVASMTRFSFALAALAPTIRAATAAAVDFNRSMEKVREAAK